jgi:hypothetical protein
MAGKRSGLGLMTILAIARALSNQRLLGAQVALEELGREAAVALLRHAQFELAHPSDEGSAVIAGAVAEPSRGALAFLGSERIGHLGFQHLLHHRPNDLAKPIRALHEKLVDAGDGRPSSLSDLNQRR